MHTAGSSLGFPRSTSAFVAVVVAGAVSLVMAACGSSSSSTCSAGDVKSCTCVDGMSGTAACGANNEFGACVCSSEGGTGGDGGSLPYMAMCMVVGNPGDCAPPDQCFNYPNRGKYCTHPCTMASDCAPPSPGCNGMGVCKAPGSGGPVDAGPMETGGPMDAGAGG